MRIRKYTLKFIKLGKPTNNQYPIYLRYYYTLNRKKYTYNYNCETLLSLEQFELLKDDELNNAVGLDLNSKRNKVKEAITVLYFQNDGEYPEVEELKEFLTITEKEFAITGLVDEFLKTFRNKVKEITVTKYKEQLSHLKELVKLSPKDYQNVDDLVNDRTISDLERHLDAISALNKHISNNSYKNIISITVRFLNFVAKQYKLTEIVYKVSLPLLSEKLHLTNQEFDAIIKYDVEKSGLRVDHRKNMKLTQDLVYINSFIGLRINELLSLRKGNLTISKDQILIRFFEAKKNDVRVVVLINDRAIKLIEHYYATSKDDSLFDIYVNVFNNNLKKLAKLAEITEDIEYVKDYRTRTITDKKPKWELISSHTIRRYAVNRNVAKYGIDVARQYSGHKDYLTIKNNYMRNLNQEELLRLLKEGNDAIEVTK